MLHTRRLFFTSLHAFQYHAQGARGRKIQNQGPWLQSARTVARAGGVVDFPSIRVCSMTAKKTIFAVSSPPSSLQTLTPNLLRHNPQSIVSAILLVAQFGGRAVEASLGLNVSEVAHIKVRRARVPGTGSERTSQPSRVSISSRSTIPPHPI